MIEINCDLCGNVKESLSRSLIEGTELNVCPECSKFGRVLGPVKATFIQKARKKTVEEPKEEKMELIVEDYPELIKRRRESMGLSQKDFAAKVNEKESVMHKIETGSVQPSLPLARKLEKVLGIRLVEEHEEGIMKFKKEADAGFTLGDFIKVKR